MPSVKSSFGIGLAVALLLGSPGCRSGNGPPPQQEQTRIYKWVDENGIAHYTTDRERIPRSLRNRVPVPDATQPPSAAAPATGRLGEDLESWAARDRRPEPITTAAAQAAGEQAGPPALGSVARAELDARIATLEAEIAADEEQLKARLSDPDSAGLALEDAELRAIAERLPRRIAELVALRGEARPGDHGQPERP